MKRHRALLIGYYFPPLGGAGVGRPLALYRQLPQYGWECHVLTVKAVAYRVHEPELLRDVDTTRIYRAGSYDPQRLLYLLGVRKVSDANIHRSKRVSGGFFPDSKVGWVRPAVRLGRVLGVNHRYDVIISTSPPISSHLVARQLATELNTPWVADFRNYWEVHKPVDVYGDPRKIEQSQNLLAGIRQQASAVTALSSAIGEFVQADEVIPNGYDSQLAGLWQPSSQNDNFVIGLLGTFDEICPVDPLLKMLATVREKEPRMFDKIKLLQVGRVDSRWLSLQLERYDLTDSCDCRGFHSRAKTIRILSDASLFYVSVASEKESGVIPGHIYTLLASGRPILAAVPHDSEVEKLLAPTGNGFCFTEDNVSNAADYLCEQISLSEKDALAIYPLPDYAREFSSENMARRFAELLDKIRSR